MGTDKRERQKQQRQERAEALAAAQRRAARSRTGLIVGGAVVAVIVVAVLIGVLGGDDERSDVVAGPTAPTEVTVPTTTTIGGTPPTTVLAVAPIDPVCPEPDGSSEPNYDFTGPFEDCLTPGVDYQARFVTTMGDVVVDLREAEMPQTVNNFVALARHHYYDGTDLFRTNTGIAIIQGGSPHTQDNFDSGPGYNTPDEGGEFDEQGTQGPFTYEPGQLVMARSAGPDSSSAQFFFSVGPEVAQLDLQGTYLLFGDVTEGLDVLEAILATHIDTTSPGEGRPGQYVIIERVEIIEA